MGLLTFLNTLYFLNRIAWLYLASAWDLPNLSLFDSLLFIYYLLLHGFDEQVKHITHFIILQDQDSILLRIEQNIEKFTASSIQLQLRVLLANFARYQLIRFFLGVRLAR